MSDPSMNGDDDVPLSVRLMRSQIQDAIIRGENNERAHVALINSITNEMREWNDPANILERSNSRADARATIATLEKARADRVRNADHVSLIPATSFSATRDHSESVPTLKRHGDSLLRVPRKHLATVRGGSSLAEPTKRSAVPEGALIQPDMDGARSLNVRNSEELVRLQRIYDLEARICDLEARVKELEDLLAKKHKSAGALAVHMETERE
ncbi:hypothetical protein N0V94_000751 [Neodidymelliopsis sp. IMI 364377]|nr:hypothetical protein N0V94_000751 [Neodidymelliopsis sp. IMI 364377]